VLLGRHSLNCFLPALSISQVHGQPKRIRIKAHDASELTLVVLPLFHPAAALYNGDMKQTLIDDFANIPAVMEQIKN
ncbi:MAG TPA: uracil-DNA glycosylase, partial [Candidatus Binatia bacterium]|nr:uracil-DNA glycosylase [Candidatus Binatia bacterium]